MDETFQEKIERVRAMSTDTLGHTWDLSDNDRAALVSLLAERSALRRLEITAREAAACTCNAGECEALSNFREARRQLDALREKGKIEENGRLSERHGNGR